MSSENIDFMRDLEGRYKFATQLPDRSSYKIFYGLIHPAKILTLGINPGGSIQNTNSDGRTHKDGKVAAASGSYFENGEHDILDCNWPENPGLRRLLTPLVGGEAALIRSQVVKTNLAFRRSPKASDIDQNAAINESAPFLTEIIDFVRPELILLTGSSLSVFRSHFSERTTIIAPPKKDEKTKHIVFAASRIWLRRPNINVLVVQVDHASQFSWTYERYGVSDKILALWKGA